MHSGECYRFSHLKPYQLIAVCSYGLSYTIFDYSNLELSKPAVKDNDLSLIVSVTITNSGSLIGSEVVQLYTTMPTTSDLSHPPLMLKAFPKVHDLEPGKRWSCVWIHTRYRTGKSEFPDGSRKEESME